MKGKRKERQKIDEERRRGTKNKVWKLNRKINRKRKKKRSLYIRNIKSIEGIF